MKAAHTLPADDSMIQQDRRFESESVNKRLLKHAYFGSHITLPPLSSLTAMAKKSPAPFRRSHESAFAKSPSNASFPAPSVRNDRLHRNSDVQNFDALRRSKRSIISLSSPSLLGTLTIGRGAGYTYGQSRRMSEPGFRERNFMLDGGYVHDRHHARLPQHQVPGRHGNFLDFQSFDFAHYADNCVPNHVHRMPEKSDMHVSRSFDGSCLRQDQRKLEPPPLPPSAFQQLGASTKPSDASIKPLDAQPTFGVDDDIPRAMRVPPKPALTTVVTPVPYAYARVPVRDAAYVVQPEFACSAAYSPVVVPKEGLLPAPVPPSAMPLDVRNLKRSAGFSDPSVVDLPPAKEQKGTRSHARSKNMGNHVCLGCQATSTPEWRKGPTGPRTLCNACGLLYAKMYRKREQDAVAAAIACNRDPAQAKKEVADALLQQDCREELLESIRAGVRVVASVKQHRMSVNLAKTGVRAMPPMIKPTN